MDNSTLQDFKDEINWLFQPELDEDGIPPREFPNSRIKDKFRLDVSYMETYDWEGSSIHKHSRICPADDERIQILRKNQDVPDRLFRTALRLFADSIIVYHNDTAKEGELRYYPPIVLTFWAAFEAYVRYSSEKLITTAQKLPKEVKNYLSEEDNFINKKGEIASKTRYHSVLDRYAVFLKYAYNYSVNKGERYWQELVKAKELRDYYTHVDVKVPRGLTSNEVLSFMESILLSVIIPSTRLQRTLMLGVYWLYEIWTTLNRYNIRYTERPKLLNSQIKEPYLFHCNFENVNSGRYPSVRESIKQQPPNYSSDIDD